MKNPNAAFIWDRYEDTLMLEDLNKIVWDEDSWDERTCQLEQVVVEHFLNDKVKED